LCQELEEEITRSWSLRSGEMPKAVLPFALCAQMRGVVVLADGRKGGDKLRAQALVFALAVASKA
jgi:hypothetical protein